MRMVGIVLLLLIFAISCRYDAGLCVESKGNACEVSDECSNDRQCLPFWDGRQYCLYRCIEDSDCYKYGLDRCLGHMSTDQGVIGFCGEC